MLERRKEPSGLEKLAAVCNSRRRHDEVVHAVCAIARVLTEDGKLNTDRALELVLVAPRVCAQRQALQLFRETSTQSHRRQGVNQSPLLGCGVKGFQCSPLRTASSAEPPHSTGSREAQEIESAASSQVHFELSMCPMALRIQRKVCHPLVFSFRGQCPRRVVNLHGGRVYVGRPPTVTR